MRKLAPTRVSYRNDFLISYRVYIMTGSFHISLFEGTLHVDKIHVWFKITNITHELLVPVYRQTDFTPERVDVSHLHDTVAKSRTGVKFSPCCDNRGELTPGRLAPTCWSLWWYHVNKCRTMYKYFWCWNWKGLPWNGKVSTIGTYRFELKLQPFLDTSIRRGIISSGTRSFLTVTETLAGTLGGLKKHLTASIGTVELRILIRGCLQSDTDQYNRTADRWRNSHLL